MAIVSLFPNETVKLPDSAPTPSSDDDVSVDLLYFVPYRWWSEVREALFADASEMKGVYYSAESKIGPLGTGEFDFATEIVVNLSKKDGYEIRYDGEEGDSALVAEWMFLRAAKWHADVKEGKFFLSLPEKFPLHVKLSVSWRSSSIMAVRICQQDNEAVSFNKAKSIFHVDSGVWGIWDFSGKTLQFLSHGKNKMSDDLSNNNEIPLKLQVCGSPDLWRRGKDNMEAEEQSLTESSCSSHLNCRVNESPLFSGYYLKVGDLGLAGLHNLGNTCFMNSAIQCLVHTSNLVDYFLGDYSKDINTQNLLGSNGELAIIFGDLVRKLWVPGATPVSPRAFKSKLAAFAPQFSGYNQHDSQEFLAFLMDGLHEDLNRVKVKPNIEDKEIEGRPIEEVADEYWLKHLACNDSIIVDLCQGQYQSTLVCPVCKKMSIMFDPFMYLSLPLPSTAMRAMTLTVFSNDGKLWPRPITVTVPKYGHADDLLQALSTAYLLKDDETLLIAEVFEHCIIQYLDDPMHPIELIRDDDKLVAYKLPKERSCLVVFTHEHLQSTNYAGTRSSKKFGIPLVACIRDLSAGTELLQEFTRLLNPFSMPVESSLKDEDDDYDQFDSNKKDKKEGMSSTRLADGEPGFRFFLTEGLNSKAVELKMNEPVPVPPLTNMFNLTVRWPDEMENLYDTCLLSNLPQIYQRGIPTNKPDEYLSLYKCFEAFLKEELLGADNMWFCPNCKNYQQASKKLDIWRLPEILIIHLKRFSYCHLSKSKLETFVDFPVDNLDLSSYTSRKNSPVSQLYKLYAVSNHNGGLGGGHYTAYTQYGGAGWCEFNDSRVNFVEENKIKSSEAYVLFYKRKKAADI